MAHDEEDRIQAESKEQIRAPKVRAADLTVATIKTYAVAMAVLRADPGDTPSPVAGDWEAATWGTSTTQADALLQVGPGSSSGLVLVAGSRYAVFVQVTGGGHIPVIESGFIRAV